MTSGYVIVTREKNINATIGDPFLDYRSAERLSPVLAGSTITARQ